MGDGTQRPYTEREQAAFDATMLGAWERLYQTSRLAWLEVGREH